MSRPRIRLLVDEHLSPKIARALAALGYHCEPVQDVSELGKGATDAQVLRHARDRNMVVVSVNYDMVLLAIEENDPVVWLDTRRRGNLVYEEMVVRMFRGAPSWEKLTGPGIVVQALKTKDVALTFDGARRLVTGRMTRARRARAKAADRRSSSGPTLMDGPSVE